MEAISAGVAKALGLEIQKKIGIPTKNLAEVIAPMLEDQDAENWVTITIDEFERLTEIQSGNTAELASARTEASIYKNLYEQILAKVMG